MILKLCYPYEIIIWNFFSQSLSFRNKCLCVAWIYLQYLPVVYFAKFLFPLQKFDELLSRVEITYIYSLLAIYRELSPLFMH